MSADRASGGEPCAERPGLLFRWSRRLLVGLALLTLVIWSVTTNGLYFWFNIGSENRLRFEYGRVVWRHVEGGTARSYAGVDGGASLALWSFEHHAADGRFIHRIPLWAPFAGLVGAALCMTCLRRWRKTANAGAVFD